MKANCTLFQSRVPSGQDMGDLVNMLTTHALMCGQLLA